MSQGRRVKTGKSYHEDADGEDYMVSSALSHKSRPSRRTIARHADSFNHPTEFNLRRTKRTNYCEDSDTDSSLEELQPTKRHKTESLKRQASLDNTGASKKPQLKVFLEYGPDTRAGSLFKSFPMEIHQNIAGFLPKDSDITRYSLICKNSNAAMTFSVWRERFARTFDMIEDKTAEELAEEYKIFRGVSRKWACLDAHKPIPPEIYANQRVIISMHIRIWQTLIINSNARQIVSLDGQEVTVQLNHDYMRKWLNNDTRANINDNVEFSDILTSILNTRTCNEDDTNSMDSCMAVQLCLAHLILEPERDTGMKSFDTSQEMVYSSPSEQQVFTGYWKEHINVVWLLSAINFFKFHLKHEGEGLLVHYYNDLEPSQLPGAWMGKIKDGTQILGSHWKGGYTFLDNDEMRDFRNRSSSDVFMDQSSDDLQDISIFFDDAQFHWPKDFETLHPTNPYRKPLPTPERTPPRRYVRQSLEQYGQSQSPPLAEREYPFKTFFGTSRGKPASHIYGRIHGLPPQHGIPGFQRVSFLKFCLGDNDEFDPLSVWGYEGCVFPGNRIMVGRWRWISPDSEVEEDEDVYSGPFIFWNVTESHAEPPIKPEEALDFLQDLKDLWKGF